MANFFGSVREQAQERLIVFGKDAGNVFQALGLWGVGFLLVQIVLGLLPMFMAITLGKTVDAMIGARGLGVVTSDVHHVLTTWLVIVIVAFLAYLFSVRFTGKAAQVGTGIREVVTFGSLCVYLLVVQQIFVALLFAVMLAVDVLVASSLRLRLVNLTLTVLTAVIAAQTLIRYTVLRSFTVGEGLAMIAVVTLVVVFLKLRIASRA